MKYKISTNITSYKEYIFILEKTKYRIIIPEFYVIQICKHWRSVAIGDSKIFSQPEFRNLSTSI